LKARRCGEICGCTWCSRFFRCNDLARILASFQGGTKTAVQ
jgi:hypothetical protein